MCEKQREIWVFTRDRESEDNQRIVKKKNSQVAKDQSGKIKKITLVIYEIYKAIRYSPSKSNEIMKTNSNVLKYKI